MNPYESPQYYEPVRKQSFDWWEYLQEFFWVFFIGIPLTAVVGLFTFWYAQDNWEREDVCWFLTHCAIRTVAWWIMLVVVSSLLLPLTLPIIDTLVAIWVRLAKTGLI